MIEVEKLSKTFTVHKKEPGLRGSIRSLVRREKIRKRAVENVSFRIDEGEIVGLVGANGAGKTTLVKMLAGIVHPSSGDARVLGHRPWERDDRLRRQMALIMGQKAQLWWDLPAADCFLLLREIYQIPQARYDENLQYLQEVLGVTEQLNIQIRRLSLGERMKMELIAALLHQPRVVYLDEPTIGLDLTAQRAIRDFILRYQSEHSPAMILTSHYMEDIERLCQRILIIREGQLVYDGPLERVARDFATHKVIVAHVRESAATSPQDLFRDFADVVIEDTEPEDASCVRVRVPRNKIADAATVILQHYPVSDLAIEEMEIGTIIEGLMKNASGEEG